MPTSSNAGSISGPKALAVPRIACNSGGNAPTFSAVLPVAPGGPAFAPGIARNRASTSALLADIGAAGRDVVTGAGGGGATGASAGAAGAADTGASWKGSVRIATACFD